jgi:hypothetical protein
MAEWFARGRSEWFLGGPTPMLRREDFLLDVCVHLYREAVTLSAIELNKDLLLARFVDVAETLGTPQTAPEPERLVELVHRYGLGREVYYALRHTEDLLPGSVDGHLLSALDPGDHDYLREYGDLDGHRESWTEPIAPRLFNYRRKDEVRARSRLPR